jgi:hypothetical protein
MVYVLKIMFLLPHPNQKRNMLANFSRNSHVGNITEICLVGVILLFGGAERHRLDEAYSRVSQLICECV